MSNRVRHCAFLNRADDRCSGVFRLGRLSDAFDYCFGKYTACPVYRELLLERRARRAEAMAAGGSVEGAYQDSDGSDHVAEHSRPPTRPPAYVQVTVAHRYAKPTAATPHVPGSPGL